MDINNDDYASITLYVHPSCPRSHRVRVVIAEKEVPHKKVYVSNRRRPPEELIAVNPSGALPTLVDRHLMISDVSVIESYLDERFPYPPLMPIEPPSRAQLREMAKYIDKEWYSRADSILRSRSDKVVGAARQELRDDILAHAGLFKNKWFFSDSDFCLLDCIVAPILWRLPSFGIPLRAEKLALNIRRYMKRLFVRDGFRYSLSEDEIGLFTDG